LSAKFFISLLFLFPLFLGTEIIQFSKLRKQKNPYSIKRNIFSPDSIVSGNRFSEKVQAPFEKAKQTENEKKLIEKMEQSIFFEGYIIKSNRSFALLSINGEYFVAGEGDMVAENIKVTKIDKKKVFLEVDSNLIEIILKGANNE